MASAGLTSEFLGQAVVSYSLQQDSYRWIFTAAQQPAIDTPANASQELLVAGWCWHCCRDSPQRDASNPWSAPPNSTV